jgi:hypothetical protein
MAVEKNFPIVARTVDPVGDAEARATLVCNGGGSLPILQHENKAMKLMHISGRKMALTTTFSVHLRESWKTQST